MNPTRAVRQTLAQAFALSRFNQRIGLVPFIPAGYPDLETTVALLPALEQAGATAIEIGFPFSDPIADGPVIQEAFVDTLARKVKIADVFATVAAARAAVSVPLVGMLSYSIVFRFGIERFVKQAKEAGFDGLILPDLPPPEAQAICNAIQAGGLNTILLVAPSTTIERRREIARLSSGFVYYLSVSGITGERDHLPQNLAENVRQLKEMTDRPICVGFGVSQPKHVRQLATIADGAIVGSAIVRLMRSNLGKGTDGITTEVSRYVRELLSDADMPATVP